MATVFRYRYELRRDDDLVSTGHLALDEPLKVGDRVTIGGSQGLVRSVEPTLGKQELQLVVELPPTETRP